MATLSINGQNVQVDDSFLQLPKDQQNATVDEIASSLKPKAEQSSVGVGEDLAGVAKSAPGRIVAGLAGIPGDLYHAGLRALGDNLTPESSYGSGAISRALGSDYEAQTGVGKVAQKAVDFAPAVIGGPETLGAKLLTRVAAPVAASEIGGQIAGPYGEVAGALAGAVGGTAAANRFKAMAAARNGATPTIDELKTAARAGYQSQDVKDVRFAAKPVNDLADTASVDLRGAGYRPNLDQGGKPVFGLVDELRTASNVADLDGIRKALGNVAKERDAVGQATSNATAARRAIDHIDNFLPNLNQSGLIAGDATKANQILGEARQNWAAAKRAEQAQTLLANAELNAASANSGGNFQNSIKQAFKPLLKNNAAKAVGYNADELAALNKVVRGTWTGSAARAAGNLLGGGGGLGMLAGGAAGYEAGGVPGAIAAGVIGKSLKSVGAKSTFNAVKDLDKLLRSRSPAALAMAASLPPSVIQKLPAKSKAILSAMSVQPLTNPVNQPRTNPSQGDS